MVSGKFRHQVFLRRFFMLLTVFLFFLGALPIGTFQSGVSSSVVYAEETTKKTKKVTISSANSSETTLSGYIVKEGIFTMTTYDIYKPTNKHTADVFYAVDSPNSIQGSMTMYIPSLNSDSVKQISGLGSTGNGGSLFGVVKSKKIALFKGSDGFYYSKQGKSRQAYYAWSDYYYDEDSGLTNEMVTYFIKVKTTKKGGFPKNNVVANVSVDKSLSSVAIPTVDTSTYANVGDEPSTGTLLAEIFYTYGGTDGKSIKKGKLSYSNIRLYPNPSNVRRTPELYAKENATVTYYAGNSLKGAYIPNRLTMASSNTYQGNTLANMLVILGGWGYLSVDSQATISNATNNNDFSKVFGGMWDLGSGFFQVSSNIVLTIISPILWFVAMLADIVNSIGIKVIDAILYGVELIGNPMSWIGIFAGSNKRLEDNLFGDIFLGFRERILNDENVKILAQDLKGMLGWFISITSIIVIVTIVVRLVFRKKNNFKIGAMWFFRLTSWFPLLAIGFAFNGIGNSIAPAHNPALAEISDNKLDMLKVMVATNGDLSKIYTDEGKLAQIRGMNEIDLEKFSLSVDEIKAVNDYVSATLGSELNAALDIQSEVDTATFDVNDYIEAIKLAGNNHTSLTSIPANQLPSNLSVRWSGDYISATGSPMLFVEGDVDRQSANLISNGYNWEGKVYIFTESNGSGAKRIDDDEDDSKRVGVRTLLGSEKIDKTYSITYNSSLWTATEVSLSKPWTYLYGADPNNNAVTENPETYYFGINSPLVKNLEESYKSSGALSPDDKTEEPITGVEFTASDIISGTEKETKVKYYFKYANAYTLALINKYQGTNSLQNDSLQLSNQSVIFLLQSNLGENGLDFFATNTNHSGASKGKSGSETAYRYKRMVRPQKVDWIASQQISGALQTFAFTMVLIAFIKRVSTMSIGDYVLGRYSALYKTFVGGSWSSAVYYNVLTFFWALISQFVPKALETSISMLTYMVGQTSKNETVGSFGSLGIGISALFLAWVITRTFTTQSGLQFSIVSSVVDVIDSIRFGIKSVLFGRYGLDNLIYGATQGFSGFDKNTIGDGSDMPITNIDNSNNEDGESREKIGQTSDENQDGLESENTSAQSDNNGAMNDVDGISSDLYGKETDGNVLDGAGSGFGGQTRQSSSIRDKFNSSKKGAFGIMSKLSPAFRVAGFVAGATAKGFNAYSRVTGLSSLTRSVSGIGTKYMPSGLAVASSYLFYKGGTMLKKGARTASKRLYQSFNAKPKRTGDGKFTDKLTYPTLSDKNSKTTNKKGLSSKGKDNISGNDTKRGDKGIKPTHSIGSVPEEQKILEVEKGKKDRRKTKISKPNPVFDERRNVHLQELSGLSEKEKSIMLQRPVSEEHIKGHEKEIGKVERPQTQSRQFTKKRIDKTKPRQPMQKASKSVVKYQKTREDTRANNIRIREEEM